MPQPDPPAPSSATVGGFDRAGVLWVLLIFGAGGTALGAALPFLAGWAARLPWVPFQGPLELLGSFDQSWLVWGRPVLGLVVGLVLATFVIGHTPVLVIREDEIQVQRRGQVERIIRRSQVDSVYPRGSKVVIETDKGRSLFDDEVEGDREAIRKAFIDHGFPWEGPRD